MRFYVTGFGSDRGTDLTVVEVNTESICLNMEDACNRIREMFEVMWGVKLVYVMPFDDLGHLVCMNSTHPNSHTEFPSDGTHAALMSLPFQAATRSR